MLFSSMLGSAAYDQHSLAQAQIAYYRPRRRRFCHADFLPLLEQVMPLVKTRCAFDPVARQQLEHMKVRLISSYYDQMMAASVDVFVSGFDERTLFTPPAQQGSQKVSLIHIGAGVAYNGATGWTGAGETSKRLRNGDVYMPITPMFHAHARDSLCGDFARYQANLCRRVCPINYTADCR